MQSPSCSGMVNWCASARERPSTSTRMLSPGRRRICRTMHTVPIWYRSPGEGVSVFSSRCAVRKISWPFFIDASSARMDIIRPTSK